MKLIIFVSTVISIWFSPLFDLKLEKNEIDFRTIQIEVEWFIKKVKGESYMKGKHNVYIVKIYEEDNEIYCITIGFIDNPLLLKYIKEYKYYMLLNEDLIILDYSNDFKEKYLLHNADCIKLLTNKQIITDKIDMEMKAIGTWPGYVCCYERGKIRKIFYENSDEIPSEKAIFNIMPYPGKVIDVNSNTFKQMLK